MLIGTLSLTGFGIPDVGGFAGFYSKDTIVEASYAAATPHQYAFWALTIAAFMTAFYSWRLMFMTFHGETRADHETFEHAHESPPVMLVPLAILAVGAVAAGAGAPFFVGNASADFWGKSLFEGADNHILHAIHEVPDWVSWAPTIAMATGTLLAVLYYILVPALPALTARIFRPLYLFFLNKWYFDELYDAIFVKPTFSLGNVLWKVGDIAIINGIIDGTAAGVYRVTARAVRLQTGYIYHYAFAMLVGLALLISYFMFMGGGR
jgi:NADH-quinone oxidoreductase subunit L